MKLSDQIRYRDAARRLLGSDEHEITDDADVSETADGAGCFVEARIFVRHEDAQPINMCVVMSPDASIVEMAGVVDIVESVAIIGFETRKVESSKILNFAVESIASAKAAAEKLEPLTCVQAYECLMLGEPVDLTE